MKNGRTSNVRPFRLYRRLRVSQTFSTVLSPEKAVLERLAHL